MGLPQLFEIIQQHDHAVPIAKLAEDHHRSHGRPLRIAVDEADWRFNNLTQAQVYVIRQKEAAFQGIEKDMFRRICRLLTLNIQLIFVFDGPKRPWKRGAKGGGKIDYRERDLLKEMLRYFGIPSHEAPGEAEAECARMQILGLVDAVFSQDSDCLMFGCSLWFRDDRITKDADKSRSKDNTAKSKTTIRVVKSPDLKEPFGLDREGIVLFAMLVGGDYDVQGLPRCGPSIAMEAVKQGLGQDLCLCRNQKDCSTWAMLLQEFLKTTPRAQHIMIPPDFPNYKTLQKYYNPVVSEDHVLLSKAHLNLDNARPMQELKLLGLTSSRFKIWGKGYMNWVGPVLLTRHLANRDPSMPREMIHDIKFIKRRAKKTDQEPLTQPLERKLTFSPFGVTTLKQKDFEGESFGNWNRDDTPFDPTHRVECEIPNYWISKVLPLDELDLPPSGANPSNKKRKTTKDSSNPVALKPGNIHTQAIATQSTQHRTDTMTPSAKRPRKQSSANKTQDCIVLSDSDEDLPPIPTIKRRAAESPDGHPSRGAATRGDQSAPSSLSKPRSKDITCSGHGIENDLPAFQLPKTKAPPVHGKETPRTSSSPKPPSPSLIESVKPLSKPVGLEEIRAARLRHLDANGLSSTTTGITPRTSTIRSSGATIDCIDLTDD